MSTQGGSWVDGVDMVHTLQQERNQMFFCLLSAMVEGLVVVAVTVVSSCSLIRCRSSWGGGIHHRSLLHPSPSYPLMSLCLSVCLSVCPCVSPCLSLCVSLCLYPSLSMRVSLCVSLSVSVSLSLSLSLSLFLMSLSVFLLACTLHKRSGLTSAFADVLVWSINRWARLSTHWRRGPHFVRSPCSHAPLRPATTARVPSPKDWTVSVGSHTQLDVVISEALPHLDAPFPLFDAVHVRTSRSTKLSKNFHRETSSVGVATRVLRPVRRLLHLITPIPIDDFWWSNRLKRKMLTYSNWRVSDRLYRKRHNFS